MNVHRRVHVLHVAVPTSGAVAAIAGGYVRDQVARGWQVTVACPSVGPFGYDAREAGADVRWWRAGAPGHLAGETLRLAGIVGEVRPDVVHLHGARAGQAGRLAVRDRRPTVFSPHGWPGLGTGATERGAARRWERWAARWTTELICLSRHERTVADRLGLTTPVTVLPHGVDLGGPGPATDADRAAARRWLGLADVPTALVVGELAVAGGQQDLLLDWPQVRARVPDAQLVLVGGGPDRDALERLAADVPGVVLAGARTDVPTWLAAADVVVVPSRWEGVTLVPVEAMASGRSVVATGVPGALGTVPEQAGAIVPPDDGPALVDAVVARLTDPALAEAEGKQGRVHVELHHDAATATRDLARLYLRLVGLRRSAQRTG